MRRGRSWTALALPIAAALLACGGGAEGEDTTAAARAEPVIATTDSVPSEEAIVRARTAANAFGRDLQSKLFAALDSGGPSRAIAYCADSAQTWTARHAREGVYLRRVSLRVRNPSNRPDPAEERELRRLDSLHRAGALPGEVVRASRGASGERMVEYVRPILVQERCLACHGDQENLAPGVAQLLATRYPSDQATGYRVGDLRGMISVRVRD